MNHADRHKRISELFLKASELPPEQREAFLENECADDPSLRDEVLALLARDADQATFFLDQSTPKQVEEDSTTIPVDKENATETIHRSPLPVKPAIEVEGYHILEEIYRGGQGIVYKAVQEGTHRIVAIKILLGGHQASDTSRKRFEREIELVAQLKHPNIVGIFHSGETSDGLPFFAMDYIRGTPLHVFVHENNLTLEETLELFAKVCVAVQYAHQHGVIHRDLKPTNILVDATGSPKVLDFGLAKLLNAPVETVVTLTRDVVGTLPYMSPEQARGNPDTIDTRTDIYSLGIILYELLTGHYPYPVVGNMIDILKHILETPPTPPTRMWTSDSGILRRSTKRVRAGECPIDNDIQTIVLKALSKNQDRRYQSAGELVRDIDRYLVDEPIEALRDSKWYVVRLAMKRHKAAVTSAFLFMILGLSGGLFISFALYSERGKHETTKSLLATSEEEYEDTIIQITNKAIREMEMGSPALAYELFQEIIEKDPKNFKALANAAIVRKDDYFALPYDSTDSTLLEEANRLLDGAIRIKPDHAGIWNIRAVVLYSLGKLKDAENACRKALAIDPEYFYAASNLAKVLAMDRRISEALESAKKGTIVAATKPPDIYGDGVWLSLGTLQLHLGEDAALKSLETASEIDSSNAHTYLILARLHLTLNGHLDYKLALELIKTAISVGSREDPRMLRTLALAYLRNQAWFDALREAKQAIRGGDEVAYGHLIAAVAAANLGDKLIAQSHLNQARDRWPEALITNDYIVHAKKGLLWFDTSTELNQLLVEAESAINKLKPE